MAETEQKVAWAEAVKQGNDKFRADDFQGMRAHYESIRRFFESAPPAWRRHYHGNYALALEYTGEPERAIAEYMKALQIEGDGDEFDLMTIHANLALTHLSLGHADMALIYLSQPEKYQRNLNPIGPDERKEWSFRLGTLLETKARALFALNDRSCARVAKEAVDILFKHNEDSHTTGRAIRTLAQCWEAKFGRG